MTTVRSINQTSRLSRGLGWAVLPAIIAGCGDPLGPGDDTDTPPQALESALRVEASTSFAQEGETVWVEIHVPGSGINELFDVSALLTWDATLYQYVGVTAEGWYTVEEHLRVDRDGELILEMVGPQGLVAGVLIAEFTALRAGPTDGFGLEHIATPTG